MGIDIKLPYRPKADLEAQCRQRSVPRKQQELDLERRQSRRITLVHAHYGLCISHPR